MKKKFLTVVAVFAVAVCLPITAAAQDDRDHFEAGVFADYFRLANADNANFWGIGGRLGVGVAPHLNLEADMAYDFEKAVASSFTGTNLSGVTVTTARSNGLRLWHGTFGPMLWFGSKRARVFVFAKGGFLNYNVSDKSALAGFTDVVGNFATAETNGVFYPGGGAEVSVGPVGLRLDIGDMMYFEKGTNHNLSIKIGPTLRF